ncbi:MAG: flagellar protein FlgN [Oligoflexia bacterium]|nr:flagellar protein FlgN [Oligoflexia bacterium]
MNEAHFQNLTVILEEEIKIHRSLLELVRHEREVLVRAQIEELESNNKLKESFIHKIRELESNRILASEQLGKDLGMKAGAVRLLELAAKLAEPMSSRLRNIHSTLELLITRIRDLNSSNAELVQSSLRIVSGALGAIKDTLQPRQTYAPTGDIKKSEVAGHFVSREA